MYRGIEDVCGKRMLLHMTPKVAANRACAAPKIEISALKVVSRVEGSDKFQKMIWEMLESFSYEDRALFVKFATGRTRLAQGDRLYIDSSGQNDDRLPHGTTCSNQTSVPEYSTLEIMSARVLMSIRLCGNIDSDGNAEREIIDDEPDQGFNDGGPVEGEVDASDDEQEERNV